MRYGPLLPSRTSSAGPPDGPVEVPRGIVPAPAALERSDARAHHADAGISDGGPRPVQPRQAVLVVTNSQQGTEQDGCRDPDQPNSKENQPEGHALLDVAYAELNSLAHLPQDAALVSSCTVRRNPARVCIRSAVSTPFERLLLQIEAARSWPGTGQPAASGLLLYLEHLGLPARAPGSSGSSPTHTLERRSSLTETPFPPAVLNTRSPDLVRTPQQPPCVSRRLIKHPPCRSLAPVPSPSLHR
jgi:hypothetical protein